MNNGIDREISFDIVEHIGVVSTYSTGWRKELNLVRWNGGAPKYDIRDWDPAHEHMSRGVTLHEKEMRLIMELLRQRRRRNPSGSFFSSAPSADCERAVHEPLREETESMPAETVK